MKKKQLRYRQIHLDFHTSPAIPEVGARFDKKQFQEALRVGHVDSITCFSSCHHGLSYHPTEVGTMHPSLSFDLLGAQMEACKEIDVKVPVYLTAGVDNIAAEAHPEWREISAEGEYQGWTTSPLKPGFKTLCFNTPYMEYLVAKIEEAATRYPEADGIFLDIIHQGPCCCEYCMKRMHERGLDPLEPADRQQNADEVIMEYFRRITAACKVNDPDMPVFHNSGHVSPGSRKVLPYFSHLELESLPTGGWGYDHFPFSAKYVSNLDLDFLGMTGKFHTTWGEFGGYKHPNALRYECAAMLAFGSKCSVGDQLHPSGEADLSTYRVIGKAYEEVEAKEPWCTDAKNVADIGLLSSAANHLGDPAYGGSRESKADTGASRVLLEGHYLFDILDEEMAFDSYRMLILPDDIAVGPALKKKLDSYLAAGGKLLLSGTSGLDSDGKPMFEIGGTVDGASPYSPDFLRPAEGLRPAEVDSPVVAYLRSQRLTVTSGASLGEVYDPYFNRTYEHFCSHQHTPYKPKPSGYSAGVQNGTIVYLAHPVFTLYYAYGAVSYKSFVTKVIDRLLAEDKRLTTNMPSTARVSLTEQAAENRHVLHLLYANTITRGAAMPMSGGNNQNNGARDTKAIEVIEELVPLTGVEVRLSLPDVASATLEPGGRAVELDRDETGVTILVDRFTCHEMVVLS
ncbi:MAG: alpha-amylase family protein [Spirochaetota bacterium]